MKPESVTDTVRMFAVREIGKNVHHTNLTYFVEQAYGWLSGECEIVTVEIKPFKEKMTLEEGEEDEN